jgi:UDP-sulfoquinovose synthase
LDLGLKPTTLNKGLLEEITNVATKYSGNCDISKIRCVSYWTQGNRPDEG